MPEIKHQFTGGKMNKDLDERLIPNGQYRDAFNVQVSTSEGSDVGTVQNLLSNNLVTGQKFIKEGSVCVGAIANEKNDKLYWFISPPQIAQGVDQDGLGGFALNNKSNGFAKNGWVFIDNQAVASTLGGGSTNNYKINRSFSNSPNPTELELLPGQEVEVNFTVSDYVQGALNFNMYSSDGLKQVRIDTSVLSEKLNEASSTKDFTFRARVETLDTAIIASLRNRAWISISANGNSDPNFIGKVSNVSISVGRSMILEYDTNTGNINVVLADRNNDVLKYSPTRLITGINIIDDMLFWTDGFTEPKKINIPRSKKGTALAISNLEESADNISIDTKANFYDLDVHTIFLNEKTNLETPIKEEHITVIKKAPVLGLSVELQNEANILFDNTSLIQKTNSGVMNITSQPNPIPIAGGVNNQNINASFWKDPTTISSSQTFNHHFDFSSINVGDSFRTRIETDIQGESGFELNWSPGDVILFKEFSGNGYTDVPALPVTDFSLKAVVVNSSSNVYVDGITELVPSITIPNANGNFPQGWTLQYSNHIYWDSQNQAVVFDSQNTNWSGFKIELGAGTIIPGKSYRITYTLDFPIPTNQNYINAAGVNTNQAYVGLKVKSQRFEAAGLATTGTFNANQYHLFRTISGNGLGSGNNTSGTYTDVFTILPDAAYLASSTTNVWPDSTVFVQGANGGTEVAISNISVEKIEADDAYIKFKVLAKNQNIPTVPINLQPQEIKFVADLQSNEKKIFKFKFPRFAYRYRYQDGEYSAISPFSQIAFMPGAFDYHPTKGYNLAMSNKASKFIISRYNAATTPDGVTEIDLIFKEDASPNLYVVDTFSPNENPIDGADNSWKKDSYTIESEQINNAIESNQLLRPYDNVPKKALAQEVSGSRIMYGNYTQGFDLKSSNSSFNNYSPNFEFDIVNYTITKQTHKSIKSLRDYQVGVVFTDKYGRETPVISNTTGTQKLEKADAPKQNKIQISFKNNLSPNDLHGMKFFVKETASEYYNLAMDRFYDAEDGQIWLSFPSSDRNKVTIDDFLILKKGEASNDLVTEEAKYKILDIVSEAPEFIKMQKTFIQNIEHRIITGLSTSGTVDVFGDVSDGPLVGNNEFKLNYRPFTKTTGGNLHEIEEDLFCEFESDDGAVSKRYKINKITTDRDADGVTTSTAVFNVFLDSSIGEDASFITDDTTGVYSTAYQDGTKFKVYKSLPENSARFDGRFFVKINNDATVDQQITSAALINQEGVLRYRVTDSKRLYSMRPEFKDQHNAKITGQVHGVYKKDWGRFACYFRNYNLESDDEKLSPRSDVGSSTVAFSGDFNSNINATGAYAPNTSFNIDTTSVISDDDNEINVGQYVFGSRLSGSTNPVTSGGTYFKQTNVNQSWADEFKWITGGTRKNWLMVRDYQLGGSTDFFEVVGGATTTTTGPIVGNTADLANISSTLTSSVVIDGNNEYSHGRALNITGNGHVTANAAMSNFETNWKFPSIGQVYAGSLEDPDGIDYAGNPRYRERIRTWDAIGQNAVEWFRVDTLSDNEIPFKADDHNWKLNERENNTVWFIDEGPYKGRKNSILDISKLTFAHCSGNTNYWGAQTYITNQGSSTAPDELSYYVSNASYGSTAYSDNVKVGPQNVNKGFGKGIQENVDSIEMEIALGGVFDEAIIAGDGVNYTHTLGGFWATGFQDSVPSENNSYEASRQVVQKYYPSSRFRWSEDPTGSVYSIESVAVAGKIRADLGEGMNMSPALENRSQTVPYRLGYYGSSTIGPNVRAYSRTSDAIDGNPLQAVGGSAFSVGGLVGEFFASYTAIIDDNVYNEDYSYAAAQLSPNFTTNFTSIVKNITSSDPGTMSWKPYDNLGPGPIENGFKIAITHSATAVDAASNFNNNNFMPYIIVDSLTGVDQNFNDVSRSLTVGLILTNYISNADDAAKELQTQDGNTPHAATDAGDPLLIWKIEPQGADDSGPFHVHLCGYSRPLSADNTHVPVILPIIYKDNGDTFNQTSACYSETHPIFTNGGSHHPKISTEMIFQQPKMNGYSQYSCNRINAQHPAPGTGVYDPEGGIIDGFPRIMPVFYTMEFVEEVGKDKFEMPSNPAIWETEPQESTPLDIYYEASGVNPLKLTLETAPQALPNRSEFRHFENATSTLGIDDAIIIGYGEHLTTADQTAADPNAVGGPGFYITVGNKNIGGAPLVGAPYISVGSHLEILKPDSTIVRVKVTGYWNIADNRAVNFYISTDLYGPDTTYLLDWHNCYTFGNGVESNRIRDNFNLPFIANGVKASTTVEFSNYKEETRKYGLIYSGLYNSNSGVNNLNQFIAAEKITKDINPIYGSVQKLYSRDSDLVALCEDRILQILANKDAVFNADNNPQLVATDRVLGTARPFVGDYGISTNPESFASESYRVYFTDKARGAVMRLSKDGLTPISEAGMSDWFKDNLKLNRKIIGSYDDRKNEYNVTLTNSEAGPTTVSFKEDVGGWVSFKSFAPENAVSCANDYFTFDHGQLYQHHYEDAGKTQFNRNTFYSKTLTVKAVNGITSGFNFNSNNPGHYFYFDVNDFLDAVPQYVLDTLPQVENLSGDEIGAVIIDDQELPFDVYRDHKRIYSNQMLKLFGLNNTSGIIQNNLAAGRFEPGNYTVPRWEIGDVLVCTLAPPGTAIGNPTQRPSLNFYHNSSLNVFLNDIPSSVKSFHAVDYEGSQARKVIENFITVDGIVYSLPDGTNPNNSPDGQFFYFTEDEYDVLLAMIGPITSVRANGGVDAIGTVEVNQYRTNANGDQFLVKTERIKIYNDPLGGGIHGKWMGGAAGGDWEVGDIITTDKIQSGWYSSSVETNKQQGQILSFIEKEGKWFNYIKGNEEIGDGVHFETNDIGGKNIQGLGILKKTIFQANSADKDGTLADAYTVQANNGGSGSISTYISKGWDYSSNTMQFDNGVNASLQVGDRIYYRVGTQYEDSGATVLFGIVENINANSVVVDESITPQGTPDPDAGDFIFFVKSNAVNSSSLLGYYADLKFENNSYYKAELFSVSAEITESSK